MVTWNEFLLAENCGFLEKTADLISEKDNYRAYKNSDGSTVQIIGDNEMRYFSLDHSEGIKHPDGSAFYQNSQLKREGRIFKDGSGYFLENDKTVYTKKSDQQINKYTSCSELFHKGFDSLDKLVVSEKLTNQDLEEDLLNSYIASLINEHLSSQPKEKEVSNTDVPSEEEKKPATIPQKIGHFFKKYKKRHIALFAVILFAVFYLIGYMQKRSTYIPIGFEKINYRNTYYANLKDDLEFNGFTNVVAEPAKDLSLEEKDKCNLIKNIYIDNDTNFSANQKIDPDTKITLQYHSFKKVPVPKASTNFVEKDYSDVIIAFQDAGFANFELVPLEDVKSERAKSINQVKYVAVNGNDEFKDDDQFDCDATVKIVYHSLKSE